MHADRFFCVCYSDKAKGILVNGKFVLRGRTSLLVFFFFFFLLFYTDLFGYLLIVVMFMNLNLSSEKQDKENLKKVDCMT